MHLCASRIAILCVSCIDSFSSLLCAQESPVLHRVTILANLSLIESGRASQAESHAVRTGVCDQAAERQVENASRTRKRTLRSGTTKETKVGYNCLPSPPSSPFTFVALSAFYPFPRESITRNERSRIRRKTKFPIRRVSAFPIYLACRGSFSSRRGSHRCSSKCKIAEVATFNCKYNEFAD